jgi:hypothetical protein
MFSLFKRTESITEPPVVIGALGGSGTRVVTLIVRRAGWYMGGRVHRKTEDSLPLRLFLNTWFDTLLDFPNLPMRAQQRALSAFRRAIARHRRGIPDPGTPWGWKNPRNMWLVPFYASIYPRLKFIHVIRDGRDMSLTNNLFLLRLHGDRLLGSGWKDNPEAAQIEAWAIGNIRAAVAGQNCTPGNYFLLRYEDLCLRPHETVSELFQFLGAAESLVDQAAAQVHPSSGIGRWRTQNAAALKNLGPSVKSALERFGYLS